MVSYHYSVIFVKIHPGFKWDFFHHQLAKFSDLPQFFVVESDNSW